MSAPSADKDILRVLELYSGIGGMHYALKDSDVQHKVIMAMDVNTLANSVYKHNFPTTDISDSAIEGLTLTQFEKLKIDMILMSPPCQPFTRTGKKKDTNDVRTKSFLHVLNLITRSANAPKYILLENVKGFEISDAHERLIEVMDKCQYVYQEFLLTPLQIGIPNSRLRYFLIAKKLPLKFGFLTKNEVWQNFPDCVNEWLTYRLKAETQFGGDQAQLKPVAQPLADIVCCRCICSNFVKQKISNINIDSKDIFIDPEDEGCSPGKKRRKLELDSKLEIHIKHDTSKYDTICNDKSASEWHCLHDYGQNMRQSSKDGSTSHSPCLQMIDFLEKDFNNEELLQKYLVPDKELKRFLIMDIVIPCSRKSTCFTKRYGHYTEGAGSMVQMTTDIQAVQKASNLKDIATTTLNRDQWGDKELSMIKVLKLRYFTPREIANILCFPQTFEFPPNLTCRQMYMMLGNSLNVHMVSILIKLLTLGDLNNS